MAIDCRGLMVTTNIAHRLRDIRSARGNAVSSKRDMTDKGKKIFEQVRFYCNYTGT